MSATYWAVFRRRYVPVSDAEHYDGIARNLASGRGFAHLYPSGTIHATAFRPPLFPGLLGAAYRVFGAHVGVGQALNLVFGAIGAGLLCVLVTEISSERAGIIAGMAFAAYPTLLANNVVLLSEPLGLVLLFGSLLAMLSRRPMLAGVLAGALSLTWTSGQGFLVLVVIWVVVKMGWRAAARVAIAGLVLVVPWSIRDAIQVGTPQLVTSNGFNLAAVYSPEAQVHGYFIDAAFSPAFAAYRGVQQHEAKWDQTLRHLAIEGLKAHPFRVLDVARHNVAGLSELETSQDAAADREDGRVRVVRDFGLVLFPIVTVLGLAGLYLERRREGVQLIALAAAYVTTLVLFTVEAPRLRAVFDVACCIGLALLVDRALRRRSNPAR
jgi:hypothetical protein